jgi:enoyl-CoA hydratase/carnithine racemase
MRLAGGDAQFAITPAKLGIAYPQEDVHRLVSLVGPGQAARLLFGAETLDGTEAERIGLVDFYRESDIESVAERWIAAIAGNDRDSIRILKRGIALAAMGARQNEQQDRDFDASLGSPAAVERLDAHRNRHR